MPEDTDDREEGQPGVPNTLDLEEDSPEFEARRKHWASSDMDESRLVPHREPAPAPGGGGKESFDEDEWPGPEPDGEPPSAETLRLEFAARREQLENAHRETTLSESRSPSDNPHDTSDAEAELQRWERKALGRLRRGQRAACDFKSEVLSEEVRLFVAVGLEGADSPPLTRAVFEAARGRFSFGPAGHMSRKHFAHLWQVRRLANEERPLAEQEPLPEDPL